MQDVSLGEMAIILLVAVLVIGPKELPTVVLFHTKLPRNFLR